MMRLILEMSEAESRAVSVERRIICGEAAAATAVPEAGKTMPSQANDGGSPSEALLLALGAITAENASGLRGMETRERGVAAGGPPPWLVEVIRGGN